MFPYYPKRKMLVTIRLNNKCLNDIISHHLVPTFIKFYL